ncbi:MAG: DUF4347 domain-containing protein [Alphaproteobacteria bacterium]|nr:DUF4347 domain-containing protein [Alphaproteobacteria bacterium]
MKRLQHDNATPEMDIPQVDAPTPEFQQGRGNSFAVEQLQEQRAVEQGELAPVDVVAIDQELSFAVLFARMFHPGSVDASGGVKALVDNVLAQADGHPVRTLTIYAHGLPGQLFVGDDHLNGADLREYIPELERLAPHFHETGKAEIHGCNFGAGKAGDNAVYVLSQVWGVPVTAGVFMQNGAPGFEGGTVTWGPDEEGTPRFSQDPARTDGIMAGIEATFDAASGFYDGTLSRIEDIERWLFED